MPLVGSIWGVTPRCSAEDHAARIGRPAFVAGCVAILNGEGSDDALVVALGGPAARRVLDGYEGGRAGYWPKVWAARGLLHVWEDEAGRAVISATADPAWRVREMSLRVIARHRLDDALEELPRLLEDPVRRVRDAAVRARRELTRGAA